jgi:hypothetical protein
MLLYIAWSQSVVREQFVSTQNISHNLNVIDHYKNACALILLKHGFLVKLSRIEYKWFIKQIIL